MAKTRRSKKTKAKQAKSEVKPASKEKRLLLGNNQSSSVKKAKKKPAKPAVKKKAKKSRSPGKAKRVPRKRKSRSHIQGWITRRRNQAAYLQDYKDEREAIQAEKPLEKRTKEELIKYIKEQDKRFDVLEKQYVPTGEYIRLRDGKTSRHWTRMRLIPDGMKVWRTMRKDLRSLDPQGPLFYAKAREIAEQYDVTVREVYTFWHSP